MDRKNEGTSEERFAAYVEGFRACSGTPTGLVRCVTIAPG